jgi:hypothetical protein
MIGTAPIWLARLALGACLMFLVEHVYAVEPVLMRNSLVKPGPVWVGQRVAALQEALLHGATPWDGAPLAKALHRTRQERRQRKATTGDAQLPDLNPC